MADRPRCLTAFAAERIEDLTARSELEEAVGGIVAQHLQSRAHAVFGALGGDSAAAVVAAVADLAHDCATLPEWVQRDFEAEQAADGDFTWTFGPAVAELIAAGVAAAAGLSEPGLLPGGGSGEGLANGDLGEPGQVMDVLEDLGRNLDCLAPYLFGSLCRANVAAAGIPEFRLRVALQAISAWALAGVGRVVGYGQLSAAMLWEWASYDHLWALVLAKGVLTLERMPPNPFDPPGAAAVAAPSELEELQGAMTEAVFGLAAPTIAFAQEVATGEVECDDITIALRSLQLAQHRSQLASGVVNSQLLEPLIRIAGEKPSVYGPRLASFLAALLQPEFVAQDPPWNRSCESAPSTVAAARLASADLRSSLGWYGDDLWRALSSAANEGRATYVFIRHCCDIAFASPAVPEQCENIAQSCLSENARAQDPHLLASLCILMANAGLGPASVPPTGSLAAALAVACPALRTAASQHCAAWRGPVRKKHLAHWVADVDALPCGPGPPKAPGVASAAAGVPGPGEPATRTFEFELPALAPQPAQPAQTLRDLLFGAPSDLRCALDGRLLTDPVRSPQGLVFERAVLAAELERSGDRCPLTGAVLALDDCRRDHALRQRAVRWLREQRGARSARPAPSRRRAQAAAAAEAPAIAANGEEPNFDTLFA